MTDVLRAVQEIALAVFGTPCSDEGAAVRFERAGDRVGPPDGYTDGYTR